jgi:hypothetical protein
MLKRFALLGVTVLALAAFVSTAGADPGNAKGSLTFPATCDNNQPITVTVNGNGRFSPAHVVDSTSVFIPQSLDVTFATTIGGNTQSNTDTSTHQNQHGDLVTCSFDVTQTFPGGSLHLFGTATGFFTPAS